MKTSFLIIASTLLFLSVTVSVKFVYADNLNHYRGWRARELFVNGSRYSGNISFKNTPLHRGVHFPGGYSMIYVTEVFPAMEYTLGFSHPAGNQRVALTLFDRWPYSHDAKMVKLPTSPTVRTNYSKIEYRWEIGISEKSSSTLLYILVETNLTDQLHHDMPHNIFITSPPIKASSTIGKGITYLQGPRNFELVGEQTYISYVVERPPIAVDLPELPSIPLRGDLIKNGWFNEGLNYWIPHVNYEMSQDVYFSLLVQEGLRIWSTSEKERAGLMQLIDADVRDADTLTLRMDVKVNKQTLGGTGINGRNAPIAIGICYEDVDGSDHCNDNIFWKGFFSLEPVDPTQTVNGQKVLKGFWYRFITDIMQLDPKPKIIRYISLEGSGWPEREGWIRDIHLVKGRKIR